MVPAGFIEGYHVGQVGQGLIGEADIHQLAVIHARLLLDSFIVELLVQVPLASPATHGQQVTRGVGEGWVERGRAAGRLHWPWGMGRRVVQGTDAGVCTWLSVRAAVSPSIAFNLSHHESISDNNNSNYNCDDRENCNCDKLG